MKKIKIPEILKEFNSVFEKNGFKAYLVGGAVRDTIMKKSVHDWDITSDAKPEEIQKIFKKVIPTGIQHGTVTVLYKGNEIEVTTFRTDGTYSDGRHPDSVSFTGDLTEDLSRRDFTMNAIAASLKDGKIIDPFNGQKDIKKKIIRTVGNPKERFLEDGLRPVRAIRFSSKLNFCIEKNTYSAIFQDNILKKVSSVSLERFRDEFEKILSSKNPSIALKQMEESGILNIFIPELLICRGCIQNDGRGFHDFDVLDHLFYACDGAPGDKMNVRLASLFHDIGKPQSKKIQNGKITFFNHEKISSEITRKILFRLKFPNSIIDNVCHLIENHMFFYESNWTDAAVRRFLVRTGYENLNDLFDLRLADVYGMHKKKV
ncbi:MAG: HD domain-containing protein, partial [Treponema sp.]|nr:HD domain-containing protein [Treponema sp.]